ncbi:sensor histidine kinase [Nocardioides yefusunii]|uniref:histidine kinase n=1 Tax=Nocardioides yefusunii TaxID=2500546 RepID=A0ABW1QUV8_9ACTN|nr:HAMP domain-containing sensor histidine kinase [Nocardioides yefusunii]
MNDTTELPAVPDDLPGDDLSSPGQARSLAASRSRQARLVKAVRSPSVRTRLTTSMAVLTALALLAAGVVIWTLESNRRHAATVDDASQQISELRSFAASGTDPETGEAFADATDLVSTFMGRSVPGPGEMLALWDGVTVPLVTASKHRRVVREDAFVDAVSGLAGVGGSAEVDTAAGPALVTVQPVSTTSAAEATTALVVVSFLDEQRDALISLMRTYTVVSLLALLLITGIAAWQSRRLLMPLRRLASAAREVSGSDLSSRVPETGNDDLTDLARTVNAMLDRLETSFEGQRRFLDDAGHELRTPLTVLSGHLELLDPDDADEVAATRDLLLDEVDRMSRLVDDLILLTKSRRPDFVTPTPTDLDDLVASVLTKARPLAPRDWRLAPLPAVQAEVDAQRITQALLQLVDNAIKHTGDGDVITLGCDDHANGTVSVWVADTGDGIAPEHRELVLQRFGRSATRPGDEGFGLGLSIVAAIADAHGGTVRLEDTPGGGATVTLDLPVHHLPAAAPQEHSWPTS